MSVSLEISNFKKVTDRIQIFDFSIINYFVGPNGSGKSTVLNALSSLNDPLTSRKFMRSNGKISFTFNSRQKSIFWDENNVNKVSESGNIQLGILLPNEFPDEKGANGVRRIYFSYGGIEHKEKLDFINDTLSYLELPNIKAERIIHNSDPWSDEIGKRVFIQDGVEVEANYLAAGIKKFNNIRYNILSALKKTNSTQDNYETLFIIIEEPENDLHPGLQKKFPSFLSNWLASLDPAIVSKIFFFISTHSPFIIGAISNSNEHKVYMLDDGMLSDLEGNKRNECSGFKGNECVYVVSRMLGADVADIGYPENFCILEEYSIQIILEAARKKNIIRNIQFISASGVSNVNGISRELENLQNLNTLLKCDPFYSNRYLIILDNTSNFPNKEASKLERIKSRLGNRYYELSKFSLEDYYSNMDEDIFRKYEQEIASVNGLSRGLIKAQYATLISDKILTKEDFSKLFNSELDFLLK